MCCFVFMTCCLDQGEPYSKDEDYSWSILSFDYIKTMQKHRKNEEGHTTGWAELDLNKEYEELRNFALEDTKRALTGIHKDNPN